MASKTEQDLERAAEAIWNAEYLLVIAGPQFDEGSRNPFSSDYCDAGLVSKPNKLMGYWGAFFNEYNDKTPHDGFGALSRLRDRFFCQDDVRKRQQKRRPDDEGEAEKVIQRFMVFTPLVSNLFQKSGVPSDEVYEPCGSVFQWQCSALPACSSRLTPLDRTFRFAIDDATQEALPIKYVHDRRDTRDTEPVAVVDHMQAELDGMVAGPPAAASPASPDGRSGKLLAAHKNERAQYISRAIAAAPVLQIQRRAQVLPQRFEDRFVGFPTTTDGSLPDSRRRPQLPGDEAPSQDSAPPPKKAADACAPVERASHLYAHFFATDATAPSVPAGKFFATDVHRFQADREHRYFQATQQKVFVPESHNLAMKRSRYIRYNISLVVLSSAEAESDGGHPSDFVSDATRRLVMDGAALPPSAEPPCRWFSYVKGSGTFQEPITNKHHDVVTVKFANEFRNEGEEGSIDDDEDCEPPLRLPSKGTISIVCETVQGPNPDAKPAAAGAGNRGSAAPKCGAPPNPHEVCHTWQMVGDFQLVDLDKVPRDADKNKDTEVVEYILESSRRYVLRIGVRRKQPAAVAYVTLEVPCADHDGVFEAFSEQRSAAVPTHSATTVGRAVGAASNRPPVPTANHVLCGGCHGVARPFVLMNRPGAAKDEGFCYAALAGKTKAFKTWEKLMMDSLKQDQNKSIVILEAGCDKKVDVSRAYSEKTFKTLKSGRCTFVRLSPYPLEVKKGNAPEPNFISIEIGAVGGLTQLEQLVNAKYNKR